MPYIITTTTPGPRYSSLANPNAYSRSVPKITREVADTRFNAADIAAYLIESITGADEAFEQMYSDAQNVSALGDTFGPLPDGTMIEVAPRSLEEMADDIGCAKRLAEGTITEKDILDVYVEAMS